MTCDGPRRRPTLPLGLGATPSDLYTAALLAVFLTILALSPTRAQPVDCPALRARLDAAQPGDPGRYDAAMRQQRDEILRTRAYADQTGCGDGVFDDPDSPQCRALARRIGSLEVGLQRLQDQASRGDPGGGEDDRRALLEEFDAACATVRAAAEPPDVRMPVDPGASITPDAPAPASPARSPVVLCVRHCDGAYYPLATDIASDRLGDMDRICQAQCPAAESSAYAGPDSEDPSAALASDGTRYGDLASAFQFRKGSSKACACRAPNQSWAEALAGAEAMLEPHKGDVTVTPAVQASMSRPVSPPTASAPTSVKPTGPAKKAPRKTDAPAVVPAPDAVQPPDPGRDLTREFRRSDPTL